MKALAILLLSSAILVLGGWHIYQHSLSGDLKRTIAAALDPSASDADVDSYQREARLHVRTVKDREVDQRFEDIVAVSRFNCSTAESIMTMDRDLLESNTSTLRMYKEMGDKTHVDAAVVQVKSSIQSSQESAKRLETCQKKVQDNSAAFPRMLAQLRKDLGVSLK